MHKNEINQLNFTAVDRLGAGVKYYDGNVALASDVRAAVEMLKVFRVNFVVMVFATSGSLELSLDGTTYRLRANEGLFVGFNSVISNVSFGPDWSCKIVGINTERGFDLIDRSFMEAFLRVKEHPVISFEPEEMELLARYYELAIFKSEHSGVAAGKASAHSLLQAFVLELVSCVNKHLQTTADKKILRQADKIFRRFVMLLAESEGRERSVSEFAKKLCVSAKYLSTICRMTEGTTAGELVTMNAVSHIKRKLLYSNMSIKEIAVDMKFDNLSFFGKYVKKHLGASPNNYRKLNGYGK